MVRSPFEVKPREVLTVITEQFYEPWSFQKSFFADYKIDTEELLALCFETDWQNCYLERQFKNKPQELGLLYQVLW